MHDCFVNGTVDPQLAAHDFLARGRELCNGNEQRTRAVGAGKPLYRGLHHGNTAARVQIAHVDVQRGKHRHAAPYRVGDVVELEVEKDLVSAALDFAHDIRACGIKKLHAYLDERLPVFALKLVEEGNHFVRRRKIQCDYNVFAHIHTSGVRRPDYLCKRIYAQFVHDFGQLLDYLFAGVRIDQIRRAHLHRRRARHHHLDDVAR